MSSKTITTVLTAITVGPFAFLAVTGAVSVKQNLQKQSEQIHSLQTEYVKLDKELEKTQVVKEQSQAEVQQLEQETADAIAERQRLEAELGAN